VMAANVHSGSRARKVNRCSREVFIDLFHLPFRG
jgi:hypothetical protein